jgi:hypothetical protein
MEHQLILGGKIYPVAYPTGVLAIYQKKTGEIERSFPRAEEADPNCICGARESAHTGPSMVRGGGTEELLCSGFRKYNPHRGDSLLKIGDLMRANPGEDMERFLALVWSGLHVYDPSQRKFVEPFPYEETGNLVGFADAGAIYQKCVAAVAGCLPRAKPLPNEEAPSNVAGMKKKVIAPSSATL